MTDLAFQVRQFVPAAEGDELRERLRGLEDESALGRTRGDR